MLEVIARIHHRHLKKRTEIRRAVIKLFGTQKMMEVSIDERPVKAIVVSNEGLAMPYGARITSALMTAGTSVRRVVLALTLLLSPAIACAAIESSEPTERLIDRLVSVDSPSEGLDASADVQEFFAIDQPAQFRGGIIGSTRPEPTAEMRELVRRGVDVLPALLGHLNDARPTKLEAGGMCTFYGAEYDARVSLAGGVASRLRVQCASIGVYTIKVGDICYVLIGQIVNRRLWALKYVPTLIVVVTSPVHSEELRGQVIADWSNLSKNEHIASLIIDARHRPDATHDPGTALARLRYYYPDEYQMARAGDLKDVIDRFEEKHPVDPTRVPTKD